MKRLALLLSLLVLVTIAACVANSPAQPGPESPWLGFVSGGNNTFGGSSGGGFGGSSSTPVPSPVPSPTPDPCCKHCGIITPGSHACGDSCVTAAKDCDPATPKGCACDG